MAADPPDDSEKPKKPAPPRVRIKASEEGAKVVAPARPLETRPVAPERVLPPPSEPLPPAPPPPLAGGTDVAAAGEAPAKEAGAQEEARAKPPPPHVTRGPSARAPQEARPAPLPPAVAPPPLPATDVKVKVTDVRAASPRAPEEGGPGGRAPAAPPAPAGEHDEAPVKPHIGTDAGRVAALNAAMSLVFLMFLAEILGGFFSKSLALWSDASHTFMDFFSYLIAWGAVVISQRRSNERETFGAHRAEIVAAFVSGLLLILVVAGIFIEAAHRMSDPHPVDLAYMVTIPLLSIVLNLYLARRFSGARDLNMRGAHLHVLSDLLSAFGVLLGGLLILATGNYAFDAVVSIFIGLLILKGAVRLVRESADILLEKTPAHMNIPEILEGVKGLPGVAGVHSIHVWSLCSTVHALSAHIVAEPTARAETQRLLTAVREKVERDFGIHFTTIQVECDDCGAEQHPTVAHSASEAIARAQSQA